MPPVSLGELVTSVCNKLSVEISFAENNFIHVEITLKIKQQQNTQTTRTTKDSSPEVVVDFQRSSGTGLPPTVGLQNLGCSTLPRESWPVATGASAELP